MLRGSRRRARRRIEMRRRQRAANSAIDVRALGDAALAERIAHALGDELVSWIRCVLHVYMAAAGALFQVLFALRSMTSPTAVLAKLVAAEQVSTSTRQIEDLVDLATSFRAWPGATAFLSTVGRESTDLAAWRAALPATLWGRVRDWLERYGHRRPHESDIALPRPVENPRLLRDALAPLVSAPEPPDGPETRRLRRQRESADTWVEVAKTNGPWRRWRIRHAVRSVASWSALREELRSELTKDSLVLRRDLLELGRRFAARGQLDDLEHVFDLSADELRRAASDPSYDATIAVQRERARRAAWRRIEVPNRFTSEDVPTFHHSSLDEGSVSEVMLGLAVSPGEVEARACVVRSPDDGDALVPGGVLVAHATDPAWTPLFARASGIVVELGGLLSHAATVAREYGIPCVANVEGATTALRDGDVVRVDGSRGEVLVVTRARAAVAQVVTEKAG